MSNNIFLDTNLWIYLYAKNPPEKYQKVAEIIKNNSSLLLISTQVLGELFHVLNRKKLTSRADAITIISDTEVDSLLIPLAMFEDLMKDKYDVHNTNVLEEIKKGEYKSKPDDSERIKLFAWLQSNSLFSLLQTNNNK